MTPHETYVPHRSFETIDDNGVKLALSPGFKYHAKTFTDLVTPCGSALAVPLHVARNPSLYFRKDGEMAFQPTLLTHIEYVHELVRGNDGLDLDSLWAIGEAERWLACERPCASKNSLSATLSAHPKVEVRLDGQKVTGTKRSRGHMKGFTYHIKKHHG